MSDQKQNQFPDFTKTVLIEASVAAVWKTITVPDRMQKWLMDDKVKVTAEWQIGSSIVIEVLEHWVLSKATGKVLRFEPEKLLKYTHLSSLSRLPDKMENHRILEFKLSVIEKDKTQLSFTGSNFPTESIYKHITFYWNTTLEVLKKYAEKQ